MRVSLNIDGKDVRIDEGATVLQAAKKGDVYIPTLCAHSEIEPSGCCRICVVEIEGMRGYPTACTTPVVDGMVVRTDTSRLRSMRKGIMELVLSEHPYTCLVCDKREGCDDFQGTIRKVGITTGCQYCPKNGVCELQRLVEYLDIEEIEFPIFYRSLPVEQEDPFFERDYNLCVLCGRCVRVCNDVRGNGTLTFGFRGGQTVVGTAFGRSHLDVGCEFCGACVDVCPTGALYDKRSKWEGCPDRSIHSVCPHCSVGCSLSFNLKESDLVSTSPFSNGTLNKGQVCMRGRFGVVDMVSHPERLQRPMVKREGRWIPTTWDDALGRVADVFAESRSKGFALIASPQGTNEDAYVLQKFARTAMESSHVANSSNFSMNGCADALIEFRRRGVPMGNIDDIERAGIIVIWGGDLSVSHPVAALKVKQAHKRGGRLIVVDARKSKLAEISDVHLGVEPGKDRLLAGVLLKRILEEDLTKGIDDVGSDAISKILKKIDMPSILKVMGVSADQIETVVEMLLHGGPVFFLVGPGAVLQESAKDSMFILANISMALGGKILPVVGENNLLGCLEMGCHPSLLPGWISIDDKEAIRAYEKAWETSIKLTNRRDLTGILKGIEEGRIRTLYAVGDIPESDSLKKLDFLVVQSVFAPEWLMEAADVILPAAHLSETDGTVMNFEGRMQRIRRVSKPPGQARPDWYICSQIAQKMGVEGFSYKTSSDVFKEMTSFIPYHRGLTPQKLGKHGKRLWTESMGREEGPFFMEFGVEDEDQLTAKGYPYTLITGWNLFRYRNGSLADLIPGMDQVLSERRVELHPKDAERLDVVDGDCIRVRTEDGVVVEGYAVVSERIAPKTAYACSSSFIPHDTVESDGNVHRIKIKKVVHE